MNERIGEFFLRIGAMQHHQVDEVLRAQEAGDNRLFGEIAIEYGYINAEAIKKYVEVNAARDKEV
jgi:hypothetical protein